MVQLCIPQVLNFTKFVEWYTQHYFETKNVIMSEARTRLLCQINVQSIYETLQASIVEFSSQELIKDIFSLVYKKTSLKNRVEKLTSLIKPNQTLEGISLPYSNHIFQPRFHSIATIFS